MSKKLEATKKKEPKKKVSNPVFWMLVILAFAFVMGAWALAFKKNFSDVLALPGNDFSSIKNDLDSSFKSLGANFKNVSKLSEKPIEPVQAFKENVLSELEKKQPAAGTSGGTTDTAAANATIDASAAAAWKDFASSHGFSLQYPNDWQAQEKKIADWFSFSLNKPDTEDGFEISDLPFDTQDEFASQLKIVIDGKKAKKTVYKGKNNTVIIEVPDQELAILYWSTNLENDQLFEQIVETIKFTTHDPLPATN